MSYPGIATFGVTASDGNPVAIEKVSDDCITISTTAQGVTYTLDADAGPATAIDALDGAMTTPPASSPQRDATYDIAGRRMADTATVPGIRVQGNRKVVLK